MNEFKGFPDRMMFTPLPNLVFSTLLPQINEIGLLKLLLHLFEIIYPKKGSLKFTSLEELLNHPSIVADFGKSAPETLPKGLAWLSQQNILLHLEAEQDQVRQDIYFLNSEANRAAVTKIQNGEFKLASLAARPAVPVPAAEVPDIFTLYEQNIGILTPLIADALRDAEKEYPEIWIQDAIKQAVTANKRNWRYIARILERWATEGKNDGTHRGNLETNTDPDKYIRGKYGHMVQR